MPLYDFATGVWYCSDSLVFFFNSTTSLRSINYIQNYRHYKERDNKLFVSCVNPFGTVA
jgi:hypothetical protein